MQELKLVDDLFPSLLAGAKLVTIRAEHRPFAKGPLLFRGVINPILNVQVIVSDVLWTTLGSISEQDAHNDGYEGMPDMLTQMRRFYPTISINSPVTLLRFTLA